MIIHQDGIIQLTTRKTQIFEFIFAATWCHLILARTKTAIMQDSGCPSSMKNKVKNRHYYKINQWKVGKITPILDCNNNFPSKEGKKIFPLIHDEILWVKLYPHNSIIFWELDLLPRVVLSLPQNYPGQLELYWPGSRVQLDPDSLNPRFLTTYLPSLWVKTIIGHKARQKTSTGLWKKKKNFWKKTINLPTL